MHVMTWRQMMGEGWCVTDAIRGRSHTQNRNMVLQKRRKHGSCEVVSPAILCVGFTELQPRRRRGQRHEKSLAWRLATSRLY